MLDIYINNTLFSVPKNISILEALEYSGIYIPRFCYHSMLSIAGNCRMCLVEIEKLNKPISSCTFPILNTIKIFTQTPKIKKSQENIIELLLLHHPLDCFICDQGSQCDLQLQALDYGSSTFRSFNYLRRQIENKFFGEKVSTIMTRCIHCTRCIRFAEEILTNKFIGTIRRGFLTEIHTYIKKPQVLNEYYLGNIIDLCPVGALTLKNNAFIERAWQSKIEPAYNIFSSFTVSIFLFFKENQLIKITPRSTKNQESNLITDSLRYTFFKKEKNLNIIQKKQTFKRFLSTLTTNTNLQYNKFTKIIINKNICINLNYITLFNLIELTNLKYQTLSYKKNYFIFSKENSSTYKSIYNYTTINTFLEYLPTLLLSTQKNKINIKTIPLIMTENYLNNINKNYLYITENYNTTPIQKKNYFLFTLKNYYYYYYFKKINFNNLIHFNLYPTNEIIKLINFIPNFNTENISTLFYLYNSLPQYHNRKNLKTIGINFLKETNKFFNLWLIPTNPFFDISGIIINTLFETFNINNNINFMFFNSKNKKNINIKTFNSWKTLQSKYITQL